MRNWYLLLLATAATVTSCLDPSGEVFVDIPHPEPGAITLDLANVSEDTIIIDRLTTLQVSVTGFSPININDVTMTLGSHPLAGVGGFQVYPPNFESGFYILTVHVKGNAGTGSLAHMLGQESFDLTRQYPVIIDKELPSAIDIVKVDTSSGTLTIFWNKCKKRNFTEYEVYKSDANTRSTWATLTNANDTSWTDPTYVGGPVEYTIIANTHMGRTWGNPLLYNWDPEITITIEEGFATARWKQTPFYNNTSKYILTGTGLMYTEASLTDTVYAIPYPVSFGGASVFNVKLVSQSEWYSQTISKEYYIGDRYYWPVVIPRLYNSKEKLYYGLEYMNGGRTVVMDEDLNMEFAENGLYWSAISSNGEYFVSHINNDFYFTDPHTLVNTLALETGEEYVGDFVIADNGLIGFHCAAGYRVVDIMTGDVKFSLNGSLSHAARLSPLGNVVIDRQNNIYRYTGSTFDLTETIPLSYSANMVFVDEDIILITDYNYQEEVTYLVEYNINTLTEISRTNMGAESIQSMQFDPVSKKILLDKSIWYYMYDPETKQTHMLTTNFMTFLNGNLFAADSYSVFKINPSDLIL